MGIDGIGSSVIIALAAVLWFIYLVPTWLRRREYLATERNAVRLQQTLRIMAETAQVPEAVRVEAHARAVAAQERALRARRAALGDTGPVTFDVPTGAQDARRVPPSAARVRPASRRLRRSRAVTSLVLLLALVGSGLGLVEVFVSGGWVLLAGSFVVAAGALTLLTQMAAVARMRREGASVRRVPVAGELYDDAEHGRDAADRGWTPQPIPKPLYLRAREQAAAAEAAVAQPAVSAAAHVNRVDPREELRAAAAAAEEELRASQASRPVRPQVEPQRAPVEARSRFARMGIVDERDAPHTDLDEILARRRAVG